LCLQYEKLLAEAYLSRVLFCLKLRLSASHATSPQDRVGRGLAPAAKYRRHPTAVVGASNARPYGEAANNRETVKMGEGSIHTAASRAGKPRPYKRIGDAMHQSLPLRGRWHLPQANDGGSRRGRVSRPGDMCRTIIRCCRGGCPHPPADAGRTA